MPTKSGKIYQSIRLGKLVHGGQCLAELPSGKKALVWGGLPGELVEIKTIKKKSSYIEALVTQVIEPSKDRVEPKEPKSYLSTSPWQIMTFEYENISKQSILEETFIREGVKSVGWSSFIADSYEYGYRNKMEFGFWGDDTGIHLAQYVRGTHGKQIIEASLLAKSAINSVLDSLVNSINDFAQAKSLRAGDMKTLLLRTSSAGDVVAALFLKQQINVDEFKLPVGVKGFKIYYSNPKSPASVPTKLLKVFGDTSLVDTIDGIEVSYDVLSFFQVNLPVFELALQQIKKQIKPLESVDMYSGVGTIGIVIGSAFLVESDSINISMAKNNAKGTKSKVIHLSSEEALEYISDDKILVVDPPRAGLHRDVVNKISEIRPPQIIYLSCNPITQARDVKLLETEYKISHAQGFNFFPHTPHIESLVILERI